MEILFSIFSAGWWYTYPSEKYDFVSWDYEIPNIWKNSIHVPNHQPEWDSWDIVS
jgi:hypothetical protein